MWNYLVATILLFEALTPAINPAGTAQQPSAHREPHFVVVLKRGPNWIPGKGASEQPLLKHGHYLQDQMDKGTLLYAGPFLDDTGGLILLSVESESDAQAIVEHDPAVLEKILVPEIHPFRLAFDATTGRSPFK